MASLLILLVYTSSHRGIVNLNHREPPWPLGGIAKCGLHFGASSHLSRPAAEISCTGGSVWVDSQSDLADLSWFIISLYVYHNDSFCMHSPIPRVVRTRVLLLLFNFLFLIMVMSHSRIFRGRTWFRAEHFAS